MAEAADSCASCILEHCRSHKLLPLVCATICGDRNAKLRQHCAGYLLQVPCPAWKEQYNRWTVSS